MVLLGVLREEGAVHTVVTSIQTPTVSFRMCRRKARQVFRVIACLEKVHAKVYERRMRRISSSSIKKCAQTCLWLSAQFCN